MIGAADFDAFVGCYGATSVSADDACAVSDLDQSGRIDAVDLAGLLTVFAPQQADCNGNGAGNLTEIADGTAVDTNFNLIPDACENVVDVPAVNEWGVVALVLLLLSAGTVVLKSRTALAVESTKASG